MTVPAIRSFPYDSVGGDAGPYDAEYFALIQQAHLGSYTRRTTASVLLGVGNGTQESLLVEETSPQSLGVTVREGWAMVNNRSVQVSVDTTVAIVQNNDPSLDDRLDSIVLRTDKSTPAASLVAKQGTVAAVPVAPTLTQNATVWEVRIANVLVQNGAANITTADIDNSVRVYAVNRSVKEGGTGLSSIAAGQLLAGSALNTLAALPAPTNNYWLMPDTSLAQKMAWIDMTPTVVGGLGGGTNITTSWVTCPLDVSLDPAGNISALAANRLTLDAGTYLLISGDVRCYEFSGATPEGFACRLQNITDGTTICESNLGYLHSNNSIDIANLNPTIFTIAAAKQLELQAQSTVGGTAVKLSSNQGTGITAVDMHQRIVLMKLRN